MDYDMSRFLLLVDGRIPNVFLYGSVIRNLKYGVRRYRMYGDWHVYDRCDHDSIIELITKYHIHVSLRQISYAHVQLHLIKN
jgi:hypothetical protein